MLADGDVKSSYVPSVRNTLPGGGSAGVAASDPVADVEPGVVGFAVVAVDVLPVVVVVDAGALVDDEEVEELVGVLADEPLDEDVEWLHPATSAEHAIMAVTAAEMWANLMRPTLVRRPRPASRCVSAGSDGVEGRRRLEDAGGRRTQTVDDDTAAVLLDAVTQPCEQSEAGGVTELGADDVDDQIGEAGVDQLLHGEGEVEVVLAADESGDDQAAVPTGPPQIQHIGLDLE